MSYDEQFLDSHIDHLGAGDSTCTSVTKNMESGQCANDECVGTDAEVDGEHEEFWRIPRDAAPGQSAVHPFLRYVEQRGM